MDVTIVAGSSAFDSLASAWEALHAVSPTATPFNSLPYARLWWAYFSGTDTVEVWVVRDGETTLGIAPLYRTADESGATVLRLVGGVDISDYLDVLTVAGREAEVVSALMACAGDYCCRLDFHNLPHASPIREAFLCLMPHGNSNLVSVREAVCPVITLPTSWEQYLAQLEGKQRREIRRKLKKAGQETLVGWYRTPPETVGEDIATFIHLHRQSGADKAAFMTARMAQFFTDLAEAFAARGWLDLLFLKIDGRYAATYLAFRFRDTVMLYNSGIDPSYAETLSPGWLLLCYHIEHAIANGFHRYDFMRGDEEYKFRFGGKSEPLYHMKITPCGAVSSPHNDFLLKEAV